MVTVCAEIVTHNRLTELQRLVMALRDQTRRPDAILVVDNDSRDGTSDWLAYQADVKTIRQENLGSGGGQHTGIKAAYEWGFDWVWCFDDDALPDSVALERLLSAAQYETHPAVYNSVVVEPTRRYLSFGTVDYSQASRPVITTTEQMSQYSAPFDSLANFFNGTLLPRSVIASVGFPTPELFIRGDELEYLIRIRYAGVKTYTVPNSLVVHPREPRIVQRFLFRTREVPAVAPWKMYYTWRNLLFINDRYDFFYHYSDRKLRQLVCVWHLLKDVLLWRFGDYQMFRAGKLAVSDWLSKRHRVPADVIHLVSPD